MLAATAFGGLALICAPALAQAPRNTLDATKQPVTAAQIAEALRPKDTRKLGPAAPKENTAIVVLTFQTGSSELTDADKAALQEFGKAIKEYIPAVPVTIEGHADPRGTDEYNLELSRRRAETVRDYLVANFAIDSRQLKVIGFGRTRIKDAGNPTAEVNRRVEFVTKND